MMTITKTNHELSHMQGASERVTITGGLGLMEAELAELQADIAAIVDRANQYARVAGKPTRTASTVASAAIFSTYASAAGAHADIDATLNALMCLRLKNEGAEPVQYELRGRSEAGAPLYTVRATGTLTAGQELTPPIDGLAQDFHYELWLRSQAGAGSVSVAYDLSVKSL